MNEFILMHKNTPVASVSIKHDEKRNAYLHLNDIFDKSWMPPSTRGNNPDGIDVAVTLWNESRCIPLGRPNYDKILQNLGILSNSEMLPHSYMCSLTDCYWFRPTERNVAWEDVNFHANGFTSNLYKRLFYDEHDCLITNYNSPDIGTDGALRKMWQQDNYGRYLLFKGHKSAPIEASYEVIADKIFDELSIEHVSYYLDIDYDNRITSSVCASFITSDNEEFVPIESLMKDYNCIGQHNFLPILYSMGFGDQIDSMLLGDSVIGNLDRHARNYGVIIDSDTQMIKRFAPLFDQGGCYLLNNHGFLTYPPTGLNFNKTVTMIPKEKIQLLNDIDMGAINRVVMDTPLSDHDKYKIVSQLEHRLDKMISFGERIEYDLDRK